MKQAIKLAFQPGIFKQGTDYLAVGRWLDGNLIRWDKGVLRSMLGWARRRDPGSALVLPPLYTNPAEEAVRAVFTNTSLGNQIDTFFGTNKAIYRMNASTNVTNVAPADFVAQPLNIPANNAGYGLGPYSIGVYGRSVAIDLALRNFAFTWNFAAWGDWTIACASLLTDKHLYIRRTNNTLFVPIDNSPTGAADVVVTDERIVMAVGSDTNERQIAWSDRENFDVWTPDITNLAGDFTATGVGRLIAIKKVQSRVIIIGENDAFVAVFLGPPYVYGFNRIGNHCGALSSHAVVATADFVMWMGDTDFWYFDGSLIAVPCDVFDYVRENISANMSSKVVGFSMSQFNEIWWLYQTDASDTDENDRYVVYNYAMKIWYVGKIDRTAGVDAAPLANPLMVDADGYIFDHELPSGSYGNEPPFIQSGPLEQANGAELLGISYLFPDVSPVNAVDLTLDVYDMPNGPIVNTATFDAAGPVSTTGILGRDVRLRLTSVSPFDKWEAGNFRIIPVIASRGIR